MMFLYMLINFADKAVIGLAAVPIIVDLHLSNEQFGQVGSAFFLFFSISAVLVGFLVNRVSTKWLLTAMALIWALTQLPMLGAVSLPILVASRIVLGAGEGPAYPVALHAVYKWFANERRMVPTSLVSIGGALGAGVVAPLVTWIILTYSWRAAFGFLGIVGLVWVAVWMIVGKEGPLDAHQIEAGGGGLAHVPYATLLTSRTALGVFIAGFSAYWALTLARCLVAGLSRQGSRLHSDADRLDRHAAVAATNGSVANSRLCIAASTLDGNHKPRIARAVGGRLRRWCGSHHDPALEVDGLLRANPAGRRDLRDRQPHLHVGSRPYR